MGDSFSAFMPVFDSAFRGIRRRLRLHWIYRAIEAGAAVAFSLWLLFAITDLALGMPYRVRAAGAAVIALATLTTIAMSLFRGAAGKIGPLYVASRLEAAHPVFANRLTTAVELALAGETRSGPFLHLAGQTEALLAGVDTRAVLRPEPVQMRVHLQMVGTLAAAVIVALVAGHRFSHHVLRVGMPWLAPDEGPAELVLVRPGSVALQRGESFDVTAFVRGRLEGAVRLEFEGITTEGGGRTELRPAMGAVQWRGRLGPVEGGGRFRVYADGVDRDRLFESGWSDVRLLLPPEIASVHVRLDYPGYTAMPPAETAAGPISAIMGTRATVAVVTRSPVDAARLYVEGRVIEMTDVGSGTKWRAGFDITDSGSYRVEVLTGGMSSRSGTFPVLARRDLRPTCDVAFLGDAESLRDLLSLGARFRVRAADDVALDELVLVVRRPATGGREERVHYIPVPGFVPGAAEFRGDALVPPQVLQIESGVTYSYYVRAADNFTPAQLATSEERTFRVSARDVEESLIARARGRKRPPLLEPRDETPGDAPRTGAPGQGGEGGSAPDRQLAGLSDGGRPSGGGQPGEGQDSGGEGSSSPYASGPGLGQDGEDEGGDDRSSTGGHGGAGRGGDGQESGGASGGREGQGDAPGGGGGQGGHADAGRGRGVSGPPGFGGSEAGGAGHGPGERRERDGGMPTGEETGFGPATPETVDEEMVAAVGRGLDDLAGLRAPNGASGGAPDGASAAAAGGSGVDMGEGVARDIGRFDGRDRIGFAREDGPTPEIDEIEPISRLYQEQVRVYFERLRQMSGR